MVKSISKLYSLILRRNTLAQLESLAMECEERGAGWLIEDFYRELQEMYFPKVLCSSDLSFEGHFKESIVALLSRLHSQMGVKLFPEDFYAAASGRRNTLSQQAYTSLQNEWLRAIECSYNSISGQEENHFLVKIAFLFSQRKDFFALDQLVDAYPMILLIDNHEPSLSSEKFRFYAYHGHLERVQYLLNKAFIADKRQMLVDASFSGHLLVVKEILNHREGRPSIEAITEAFLAAAEGGSVAIVEYLCVLIGPALSMRSKSEAFERATRKGGAEVARWLLDNAQEAIGVDLKIFVFERSVKEYPEVVVELLNSTSNKGQMLIKAAGKAFLETVQKLLECRAEISVDDKRTALEHAQAAKEEVVKQALKHMEDCEIPKEEKLINIPIILGMFEKQYPILAVIQVLQSSLEETEIVENTQRMRL